MSQASERIPSTLPQPQPEEELRADDVVGDLLASYDSASAAIQHVNSYELPSTEQVASVVEQCRALLFPGFVGASLARATPTELRDLVRERLDKLRHTMRKQLYRDLHHRVQRRLGTHEHDCPKCAAAASNITDGFLRGLVALRERIALDVQAALDGDPAAKDADEVIFCYPGLYAISVYRMAHALLHGGARLIPRIMTELAHEKTGIDIHPGATIGDSFFIDHGTGVVIGETTVIGKRVRIYQGVTLGALSVPRGRRGEHREQRHPSIEDDVVIYAGATILGGDTVIGKNAVIGGNCWVTSSVPPFSTVTLSRCNTADNRPGEGPADKQRDLGSL
ncbi:Serine O-acetyltransferase [Haliangium ochraceum DSM 14365]|uniref:Serine O-acetyltransferase n=1 Tax=Haliangium ochraceum (strain DSM 14365 / JCM 11303 / SMP-2) TaxID=502025 RepID=D0LTM0_HALO1|nr:Serine O-acetyltransferase [Haliangium ochraceum DSM 14365]